MTQIEIFSSAPAMYKAGNLRAVWKALRSGVKSKGLQRGAQAARSELDSIAGRAVLKPNSSATSKSLQEAKQRYQSAATAANRDRVLRFNHPIAHGAGRVAGDIKNVMTYPITSKDILKKTWKPLVVGGVGYGGYQAGHLAGNYAGQVEGSGRVADYMIQHPWQTLGVGLSSLFGQGQNLIQYGLQQKLQDQNLPMAQRIGFRDLLDVLQQRFNWKPLSTSQPPPDH